MSKRIVIALGGNALGHTLSEQARAVKTTARAIVDLIEDGQQVVVAHGNGPQVGIIYSAMAALEREDPRQEATPLAVCGAMSQAYIGHELQRALRHELLDRGIGDMPVCSIVTQVEVDPGDPAFAAPSKPIGRFMTREEAERCAAETDCTVGEDAGRGWRRYVASPRPRHIVEVPAVRALMQAGQLVICCGGGGVPVRREGEHGLQPVEAVIDKDFAAELLAEELEADTLIILTAVERVAINFRREDERWLPSMTVEEARRYMAEGQFAPGSMLPKVEAAVRFAQSRPGREALITLLERARDGIAGKTGTVIRQ